MDRILAVILPLNIEMDWHTLLQILRDVLTVVGASKLVYEGYRQIKKNVRFQRTGKKFQDTGKQIPYYLNLLYKKAYGVSYSVQLVRHSLQKKSNGVGKAFFVTGIPFFKKSLSR